MVATPYLDAYIAQTKSAALSSNAADTAEGATPRVRQLKAPIIGGAVLAAGGAASTVALGDLGL